MTIKQAVAIAERVMQGDAYMFPVAMLRKAHDRLWSSPVAVEKYLEHIRALSTAIETAAE